MRLKEVTHGLEQLRAQSRTAGQLVAPELLLCSRAALFEQLAFSPVRASAATTTFRPSSTTWALINPPQTFNDGLRQRRGRAPSVCSVLYKPAMTTPTSVRPIANALATIEANAPSVGRCSSSRCPTACVASTGYRTVVSNHVPLLSTPAARCWKRRPHSRTSSRAWAAPAPLVERLGRFNVNVRSSPGDAARTVPQRQTPASAASPVAAGRGKPQRQVRALAQLQRADQLPGRRTDPVRAAGTAAPWPTRTNSSSRARINPDSTMAMGFVDGRPALVNAITTFVGNSSAALTSAQAGDYFDNGSIAHFSRHPGPVPSSISRPTRTRGTRQGLSPSCQYTPSAQ